MATLASDLPLRTERWTAGSLGWVRIPRDFLLVAVPLIVVGAYVPAPIALLVTMVVVGALAWRAPVRGVYFLVAAAVIVESFPLGYADSLTDRVALFGNLSNLGLSGIAMSPLEVLMV